MQASGLEREYMQYDLAICGLISLLAIRDESMQGTEEVRSTAHKGKLKQRAAATGVRPASFPSRWSRDYSRRVSRG